MKLVTISIINRGGSGPLHVSRGSSGNPLHEAWLEAGQQVANVDVDVLMLLMLIFGRSCGTFFSFKFLNIEEETESAIFRRN